MLKKNRLRPFIKPIYKWNIKNTFAINTYSYAIASDNFLFLKKNQIESCRKIISRLIKLLYKTSKFIIIPSFKTPITKKSLGARMGRGKGSISEYVYKLCKNNVLFTFKNINLTVLKIILNKIKYKLPIKLKIIAYHYNGYCRNKDKLFR